MSPRRSGTLRHTQLAARLGLAGLLVAGFGTAACSDTNAYCFGKCRDEVIEGAKPPPSTSQGGFGGGVALGGSGGGTPSACPGIDLSKDIQNCGECGNSCVRAAAIAACTAGVCSFKCAVGNHDLDKKEANGCEYNCSPSAGGKEVCDTVDNDCDGKIDEGFLETFPTDPNNCGGCNRTCIVANGLASCAAGKCVAETCNTGFTDDPKTPENDCNYKCQKNGTEVCGDGVDNDCNGKIDDAVGLDDDALNCGECNKPCVGLQNTQPKCAGGKCVKSAVCAPGYFDGDGKPDNGCEAPCSTDCSIPFAVTQCQPVCKFIECFPNYYDLDGKKTGGSNGCEYACVKTSDDETCDGKDNNCDGKVDEGINLQTDAANCGSCGVKCALLFPHAEGTCQAGKCTFSSCKTGFVDANGTAADGCEYACVKKNGGVESCNDLDDDCNGSIDDGPSEVGLPCGEAKGACASGYQVCRNGGVECVGGKLPSAEVCDAPSGSAVASFDNDCNGKTDAEEGCVYPAGSEIRLDGGAKGADNSFQLAAAAAGGDFLAAFADDRNATKNGKVCSGGIIVDTKPSAAVDRTGNIDIFVKSSVDGGATWGSEAKVGGDLDATGNVPCGAGSIPKAEAFLASTLEPSVFLKQGRGYVAFTYFAEDQGRVRRIYVASANSPYTSWSPAKRIDAAGTNKTIDLFGPQGVLAKAGGSDTIAVIWSAISGSATDPQRDVFLASSGDGGGSFQAPVRVNTTAGNAELPVVATDGNGKVFVAWRATNDKRAVVRMVDVSSGTPALGAEQTLQPGGASTETVVVAADGQGNAHVAWLDLRSGGDGKTIRVSTSTDGGGSWPADGVLANPDGAYADAGAPTLAAVDGRAALAWEDTRSGAPDIYVNRWRSTTKTWGASSARADGDAAPGATASRAPSIALGPNGLTYVAWQDSRTGSNPGIFANVSLDGGASFPASATFPARLDQSGANDTQDVRMLSASGAPQAAAVWIRAVGTKGDVYARPLAP